jgi:hypothetical protein
MDIHTEHGPKLSRGRRMAGRARRTLGNAAQSGRRTRQVLLAALVIGLVGAPLAAGAATDAGLDGGRRNPDNNTSSGYQKETEIVGTIAQGQGGVAANTGGYTTRQSNKSETGGGAIYGCRAKAGTESCVAANNLNNGDAFRFQTGPGAGTVGQIRFGLDINAAVDKPPFATNGTGLVKNLNADQVDGKSADDFVGKGSLLFAVVAADGSIGAQRGVPTGGTAALSTSGGDRTFTVPFSADVSHCSATATPTDVGAGTLAVAVGSDQKTIAVSEDAASPASGFHLQVVC